MIVDMYYLPHLLPGTDGSLSIRFLITVKLVGVLCLFREAEKGQSLYLYHHYSIYGYGQLFFTYFDCPRLDSPFCLQ